MRIIVSLFAGMIFGLGLVISGMANPMKVQNFLDIFGTWDPSLAFVMGGAIAVAMPAFWFTQRISKPYLAESFNLPTSLSVDKKLLSGSAIFGAGWGLVGLCPGPAIVALTSELSGIFIFFGCMIVGVVTSKAVFKA